MSYIWNLFPAEVMMVVTLYVFGEVVRVKRVVYQDQSFRIAWQPHVQLRAANNLGNAKFILGACLSRKTRIPIGMSKSSACIQIFLLDSMICKLFGNFQHGDINRLLQQESANTGDPAFQADGIKYFHHGHIGTVPCREGHT